jgi:hypothetical protein
MTSRSYETKVKLQQRIRNSAGTRGNRGDESATADEARQQILTDLEVDEGAYDDDLEPIESGAGACTVAVESTHESSHIPRALAG